MNGVSNAAQRAATIRVGGFVLIATAGGMRRPAHARTLSERDFQRQVVELAKICGWRVYHPFLSKWSERGFPDLTMVRARDGRLIFAELKTNKGRLTSDQAEWQNCLGTTAAEVYVWRPADFESIADILGAGVPVLPRAAR